MARPIEITIQGVVGTHPVLSRPEGRRPFCHFRLATTHTYRNSAGQWVDGQTLWFTAKAWGPLAVNLAQSLRRGDPVLLTGRLSQETWQRQDDGSLQTTNVLTVTAGGHDLTRGTTHFARASSSEPQTQRDQGDRDAAASQAQGDEQPEAPDRAAQADCTVGSPDVAAGRPAAPGDEQWLSDASAAGAGADAPETADDPGRASAPGSCEDVATDEDGVPGSPDALAGEPATVAGESDALAYQVVEDE